VKKTEQHTFQNNINMMYRFTKESDQRGNATGNCSVRDFLVLYIVVVIGGLDPLGRGVGQKIF